MLGHMCFETYFEDSFDYNKSNCGNDYMLVCVIPKFVIFTAWLVVAKFLLQG